MKNTNNVPRLRFPKFTDDWEQRKLGECVTFLDTMRKPLKESEREKGIYPYYGASGIVDYVSDYIFDEELVLLSEDGANITDRNYPVCFLASGKNWVNNHAHVLKVNEENENNFICNSLERMDFTQYNSGMAMPKLNKDVCHNIPLFCPVYEEQKQIGDFFRNLDAVITLHQRKCDKLEEYKKAMLQKIFSQELRFKREDGTEYSEWEEKKFGTTVLIERGGSPRPIKQYITNGDGYNWVKIGDAPEHGNYITHTEEKIKKSGLNKTRQVFKGDLILSNSMSFGKPYIMAIDGCIHDGWLLIRNNQNIYNLKFLCYLLGTDYMLKQYKSLAGGSTVNNLNKELVSMTTVSVPCLEEQQKIADFLSALDEAISYAKQELDKWKELKKGLLQQMFV